MWYESNYLMHYRTKGSKNGQRRYQNEDGSLTAEGREWTDFRYTAARKLV